MSVTVVVINDFEHDRKHVLALDSEDFARVHATWERSDTVLVGLQDNPLFAGRLTWADLDPTHFRVMIMRNLSMLVALPREQAEERGNAVVRSLIFLVSALVHCVERRTEAQVEMLRLNRITDTEVSFDFHGSLNLAVDYPRPKPGLRVIVNNE